MKKFTKISIIIAHFGNTEYSQNIW